MNVYRLGYYSVGWVRGNDRLGMYGLAYETLGKVVQVTWVSVFQAKEFKLGQYKLVNIRLGVVGYVVYGSVGQIMFRYYKLLHTN